MQLANGNNGGNMLQELRQIGRLMGYDEDWVQSIIERGTRYTADLIRQWASDTGHQLSARARSEVQHFSEQLQGHEARNENNGIGPMECGWHAEDQCESLSNSPSGETMAKRQKTTGEIEGENDNAQHGLDSIDAEGPVWTHFPNTQRARLKWRATVFQQDQSKWLGNLVPFDNVSNITTTKLSNTSGGAVTGGGVGDDLGQTASAALTGYDFYQPYLIQLRMTSPYNIMKTLGSLNNANSSVSEPNWLALFDNRYQYYQVAETDWGVHLSFGTPRTLIPLQEDVDFQNFKLKVFWRYTNQDDPPTNWSLDAFRTANVQAWTDNTTVPASGQIGQDQATETNISAAPGATPLTSDDYERMGGWKMKTVAFDRTKPCSVHLGGRYKFGQCKMDIKTILPTDAAGVQATPTAEGMSLTRTTPAFPELLSIIIVNDYATSQVVQGSASTRVPFSMQFDTNQLVNFADLRANFKYPTPNCAATSGGNMMTDEQYFWRGAAYS